MNALRILLILTSLLYFFFVETHFLLYFISLTITYYLLTLIFFSKDRVTSSKLNYLMSMWTYPSDPTIYVRFKIKVSNAIEKLKQFSIKHNIKLSFTALCIKAVGNMLNEFKQANSRIIFGKIVPRESCDVSLLTLFDDDKQQDILTIRNCDKKTIIEIQKEINVRIEELKQNKNKDFKRRMFVFKWTPSL